MSVPTFPYTSMSDAPTEGQTIEIAWSTEITRARSGREQRRQLWTVPMATLTLRWDRTMNASTHLDTIWGFYQDRKGSLEPFCFIDFDPWRTWKGVHVGVGNGFTTIFDLPSKSGSLFTVRLNGVVTVGYSVTTGGGSNGRDRITFNSPPLANTLITCDFKGQRAFVVRFKQDNMSYRAFSNALYEFGIEMVEVKGEA